MKIEIEFVNRADLEAKLQDLLPSLALAATVSAGAAAESLVEPAGEPEPKPKRKRGRPRKAKAADPEPAEPAEPSNVVAMEPAEPEEPGPGPIEADIDETRDAFKKLTIENYEQAWELLQSFGVESFNDIVEQEKIPEFHEKLQTIAE